MSYFYSIFGFVLREIYQAVNNYGLSLIIFTFIARLLMFPMSVSQQKGTAKTQRMQTKIRKIQAQFAGDQKKIQEETQNLYAREGHSPMSSGCLPLLLQLPIIYGLIGVIYKPLTYVLQIPDIDVEALTSAAPDLLEIAKNTSRTIQLVVIENIEKFSGVVSAETISKIQNFDFSFLGFQLGQIPSTSHINRLWAIPIASAVSSLASSLFMFFKQRQTSPEMAKNPAMGCMTFGMPLFSLYFTFQFPIGIGIYWTASNLFAFLQTVLLSFTHNPKRMLAKILVEETIQRRSREDNLKRAAQLKNK